MGLGLGFGSGLGLGLGLGLRLGLAREPPLFQYGAHVLVPGLDERVPHHLERGLW